MNRIVSAAFRPRCHPFVLAALLLAACDVPYIDPPVGAPDDGARPQAGDRSYVEVLDDDFTASRDGTTYTLGRLELARVEMAPTLDDWQLHGALEVEETELGLRVLAGPGHLELVAAGVDAGLVSRAVLRLGGWIRTVQGGRGSMTVRTLRHEGDLPWAEQHEVELVEDDWREIRRETNTRWAERPLSVDASIVLRVEAGAVEIEQPSASASHVASGSYQSRVIDLGFEGAWVDVSWEGTRGPSTTVQVQVRAADEPGALAAQPWSAPTQVVGRFAQYRLELSTEDPGVTPSVQRVWVRGLTDVGPVAGQVRHAVTGAPIQGAKVSLAGRTVQTGTDGRFLLYAAPGQHTLRADAVLFEPFEVEVEAGGALVFHPELRPTGEWPVFRGSTLRRGVSPVSGRFRGAPGIKWALPLPGGPLVDGAVTADVDGDGVHEVLSVERERIVVRDGEGRLRWRSEGGVGNELGVLVAVADLDADGTVEVVAGNAPAPGVAGKLRLGRLVVLDGASGRVRSVWDGTELLGDSASSLSPGYVQVGNFDADPELEAMLSGQYWREVQLIDFSDGADAPELRWRARWSGYKNYVTVTAGDLDGDGFAEGVVLSTRRIVVLNGADGAPRYSPDISPGVVRGDVVMHDLDHDGDLELLLLSHSPPSLMALDDDGTEVSVLY